MNETWDDVEEAQTKDVLFSRRNRIRMIVWSAVLLTLWSVLFFGSGLAERALNDLRTTPVDPKGWEVVKYGRGEPKVRAARESDMQMKKYGGVATLTVYGGFSAIAVFLLVSAAIDYRTRLLGWAIRSLPGGR